VIAFAYLIGRCTWSITGPMQTLSRPLGYLLPMALKRYESVRPLTGAAQQVSSTFEPLDLQNTRPDAVGPPNRTASRCRPWLIGNIKESCTCVGAMSPRSESRIQVGLTLTNVGHVAELLGGFALACRDSGSCPVRD
jgi:hypothetical protein